MAFKVKRDKVYGDFKAVERVDAERELYGCECVRCGRTKNLRAKSLKKEPVCGCDQPLEEEIVQVVHDKGKKVVEGLNDALKTLTQRSLRASDDEDDTESTLSMFKEEAQTISDLLENMESAEGAQKFQLVSLKMFVDLIPIAEKAYRDDPRQSNAYTLNGLVTQVRELLADLTSEDDRSELIGQILNDILQPAFLQVCQVMIDNLYSMRQSITQGLDPDVARKANKVIDESMKDMAEGFQSIFYSVRTQVAQQVS